MSRRQPHDPAMLIRRLRASLDQRAGDVTVTPAFVWRVQRLRRRRYAWRIAQAVVATALVVAAAVIAAEAIDRPTRVEFVAPPSPTASEVAPSPSAAPSGRASEAPTDVSSIEPPEPADDPAEPAGEPVEEEPAADGSDGTPTRQPADPSAENPPPTQPRLIVDGREFPPEMCTASDGTLVTTIDLVEAETAYILDLSEPMTMTIQSVGLTDVSDSVVAEPTDGATLYTATFESDTDDFEVSEVRVLALADTEPC